MSTKPVSLLTPKELSSLLSPSSKQSKPPVVLDASWHMPASQRSAWAEYRHKRIHGAAFWDVDQIAGKSDVGVPHNIPSVEQFEDACSRLGIARDSHVVVYDTVGVFSSPRTAFTFKHFGHDQVSILDGGLPRWLAEGLPIDTERPTNPNPHAAEAGAQLAYGPIFSELLYAHKPRVESYFIQDIEEMFTEYKVDGGERDDVRQWSDMTANADKGKEGDAVVDARPAGRFHGTDPEPREGLSSGHIPHSLSLPFSAVLSPESSTTPPYKTLLAPADLERVLSEHLGADVWAQIKQGERAVTSTCGSGMTAAVLWLALQRAGAEANVAIYDESWTGYASRPESKIEKS
ncbi:thiosulfate sulfurtransferase [Rhodotorula paludigena]|uniref:thiosulfate sulfurtransferase n=1 Tax=Rhodotorula paludigena TaxID=86838 RepID=UPI00317DC47B